MWNGESSWPRCCPSLQTSSEFLTKSISRKSGGIDEINMAVLALGSDLFHDYRFLNKTSNSWGFYSASFYKSKVTVENSECLRRGGRSAPFVVPLRRWHLTAERGSLGGRSAFSFSRLNWRFAPSKTCGTLSPVEHATLFQSRKDSRQTSMTGFLGVVCHN